MSRKTARTERMMRGLFVIGRTSSFTYKDRAVDVKQVGRELGVRYVLEGTVRRHANRVRITAQLIDTSTGGHIWVDRFEGRLEDIFDLQDKVTESVVGAIAPKLEQAEIARIRRNPTENLDAYDCFLRGVAGVHQWTREGNSEALSMFYRAIELDANFAAAFGMAARCYSQRKWSGWVSDRAQEIAETNRLGWRAVDLGRDDAVALCTAGLGLGYVVGDLDAGDALIDRAIVLNPNLSWAWSFSAWMKLYLGEAEAAIERATRALRLRPHDPNIYNIQSAVAYAHFMAGRYAEALSWAEVAARERPSHAAAIMILAASYAVTGRQEQARKAVTPLLELNRVSRISYLQDVVFRRPEDLAKLTEGLRKAGLPE